MKIFLRIVLGLVSFFVVCVFAIFCWLFSNPFNNDKFAQDIWLQYAGSGDTYNPRGPMVEDLIEGHLKVGLPKNEVIQLLGTADTAEDNHCDGYILGMWSGFAILDYDYLHVCYDGSDKLVSAFPAQH
jgi:hypothetical protein